MPKVLIIDDSAMVRKILSRELQSHDNIEVVGAAPEPYTGRNMIIKLKPDVLILDVEMPRMDGLTFLRKLMAYKPMPVIILSSLTKKGSETAVKALEYGAFEVMCKPGPAYTVGDLGNQLAQKIKAAGMSKNYYKNYTGRRPVQTTVKSVIQKNVLHTTDKIIAIGASTGGTEAVKSVIRALPALMPCILVVIHMPPLFTSSYAKNLNRISRLEVKEAEDGEPATPGKVLVAPGGMHLKLLRSGARYYAKLGDEPPVWHQKPAVELLFSSVAKYAGPNSVGVILTGMGKDGAAGLLEMKDAGAYTISQDEKSCVVYGMPREAELKGAVKKVLPLDRIPQYLVNYVQS